jgi:CBS domain-containing protein
MVALSGWFLVLSARAIRERIKVEELIGDLAVSDVMEVDTPTVHPGLTVDTFAGQLLDGDVPTTAIPVLGDGEVIGILGVRQVQRLRPAEWAAKRVEDVMARPPRLPFVAPEDGLVSAVERLQRSGLDGLPVVEHGRLMGVLTRRSIGLAVQARTAAARPDDPASAAKDPSDAGPDDGGDHDADRGDDDTESGGNPGSTPGAPA